MGWTWACGGSRGGVCDLPGRDADVENMEDDPGGAWGTCVRKEQSNWKIHCEWGAREASRQPREHRAEGRGQRTENMQRVCLTREGGGQGSGLKQGEPTTLSGGREV